MKRFLIRLAIRSLKKLGDETLKKEILTEAVKDLYNTVSSDDILKKTGDVYYFEGKPMLQADYENLIEELKILLGLKVWRVLKKDFQYQVNKKMFLVSRVPMDVVWGQLLTWYDDVMRNAIQRIRKLKVQR